MALTGNRHHLHHNRKGDFTGLNWAEIYMLLRVIWAQGDLGSGWSRLRVLWLKASWSVNGFHCTKENFWFFFFTVWTPPPYPQATVVLFTFLSSRQCGTWKQNNYLNDEIEGHEHGHGTGQSANGAADIINSVWKYISSSSSIRNIWTLLTSKEIDDAEMQRRSIISNFRLPIWYSL